MHKVDNSLDVSIEYSKVIVTSSAIDKKLEHDKKKTKINSKFTEISKLNSKFAKKSRK